MLFQSFRPIRIRLGFENAPRQQHTDRLAADKPGANHARFVGKQISECEITPRQVEDIVFTTNQVTTKMFHHLFLLLLRDIFRIQFLGLQKEAMPVIKTTTTGILDLAIGFRQKLGCFKTVGKGDKAVTGLSMRQEHGRGMSLPDLEWVNI